MTWLNAPQPPSLPPTPHVQLAAMLGAIAEQEAAGMTTPAVQFLRMVAPKEEVDKWGQPLPLAKATQDRVDRIFAVLSDPYARVMRLVRAGELIGDEVVAIKTAFPDVYAQVVEAVARDLMHSTIPLRAWAEGTLTVLLEMPPAQVVQLQTTQPAKPKPGTPEKTPDMSGTAADRRDIGVRKDLR